MQSAQPNHYATLGLDQRCTLEQIRAAYRLLAKQFHPDVNQNAADAVIRTQQLNAAYETLSDPERRQAYDASLKAPRSRAAGARSSKAERNVSQDAHLRFEDLLRGTNLEVRVNYPANPDGTEMYELNIPPETAPGSRFRVPRAGHFDGGFVLVRVCARPDFRFKPKGSDLKCDLRISNDRAKQGGYEMVRGLTGSVRVQIPRGVGRGETVRVPHEGLPKPRGGRGDLLVKIVYRPEVRITRASKR